MLEKGGKDGGGVKRVASAPDFSDYLRRAQEADSQHESYGIDSVHGCNMRKKLGSSAVKRSQSLMSFEQYFDNAALAGDLLLQFAGISAEESYTLDGQDLLAIDSLSCMNGVAATNTTTITNNNTASLARE